MSVSMVYGIWYMVYLYYISAALLLYYCNSEK